MKRIIILLLTFSFAVTALSHPWKPRHYIIVDTDAGADDMKAISMLLASPDIRVLAISVSPGALNANAAWIKVKSLLNGFHHEGIPVGINTSCKFRSPDLPLALNYVWGEESQLSGVMAPESIDVIREILSSEKNKITMVCLGGLSTAASAFAEIPQFRQKVKGIIWSADGLNDKKGFNYNIDAQDRKSVV